MEMDKLIGSKDQLTAAEDCLGCGKRFGRQNQLSEMPADHYLTMLRSPRAHVVSQFFYLKNSGGWCHLDPKQEGFSHCCENFPPKSDVEMLFNWIEYYADPGWSPSKGDYLGSCYTPHNMQARALTCSPQACFRGGSLRALTWEGARPSVVAAIKAASDLDWVGIEELYDESMCLFEYRLMGKLPPGCACGNNQKWQPSVGPKQLHQSGGKEYEVNIGDIAHQNMLDNMTRVDAEVYRVSFVRLVRELRAVENETGVLLLCSERAAQARALTDYIPGLWQEETK